MVDSPDAEDPGPVLERTELIQFIIPLPDKLPYRNQSTIAREFDELVPGLPLKSMSAIRKGEELPVGPQPLFVSAQLYQTHPSTNAFATVSEAIMLVIDRVHAGPPWLPVIRRRLLRGRFLKRLHSGRTGSPEINAITVASVVTPLRVGRRLNDEVDAAFERSMLWLREIVGDYRVRTGSPVRLPAPETMPGHVMYFLRDIAPRSKWREGSILRVGEFPFALSLVPHDQEVGDGLVPSLHAYTSGHPTGVVLEHLVQADVASTRDGDLRASTVLLETSVEVAVDSLMGMLLWELKTDLQEARAQFAPRRGFTHRMGRIALYLPGNWDSRHGGPVGSWHQNLAKLRHRVVHEGYEPTRAEAALARTACVDMHDYIAACLLDASAFPKTAISLLGPRSIERIGTLTADMTEFLESGTQGDWMRGYLQWMRDLQDVD